MSFLDELKKQKDRLKVTETLVTNADGRRFMEKRKDGETQALSPSTYGFIVDTKPDNVPILVADTLYIGSQDCADANVIDTYNIKHVLSVGIKVDNLDNVRHKYVKCLDLIDIDIKPVLREALPFIREAVDAKENVLVHCNAGVSRASSVVIAYLMHYENMQFDDAYYLVKDKRPAIQPNAGFRKQLQAFSRGEVI